jgi:hypothetical protein
MKLPPPISARRHALVVLALLGAAALPAAAHDYPTAERVLYVQDCMNEHAGPPAYEMIHKCSCVIDRIARDLKYDDYLEMSTATKATSIGGERGNVIRDTEKLQEEIRRYRKLQADAKKGCFIQAPVR